MKLPYTHEVRLKIFSPDLFDELALHPFCFFLDSALSHGKSGRYSFFGFDPVRTFSSSGGFVTIDNHTFIDNPIDALTRFEVSLADLPHDPYLPLSGGLIGFVGHTWPDKHAGEADICPLPDAWFGLYDTLLTYDHLEGSCWISSMGLTKNGKTDIDLAKMKCERLESLLTKYTGPIKEKYIIKPLVPEPVSSFSMGDYIKAVDTVKNALNKKEWQRANIAQRFHAPVAKDAWSIHKMLRKKNPTPYSSFMRCGGFELSSSSPSCFMQIEDNKVTCNVIQKSIAKDTDSVKDRLNKTEMLLRSQDKDPVVMGDGGSLEGVLREKPELVPAHLESDSRSHYLVNRIMGEKERECTAIECLSTTLPGASMTGVPKAPVNSWLRKAEPAKRHVYTGAMGYIGTKGGAQFNLAVRTMMVKDQIAFIHSGWQVESNTDAEEVFRNSRNNINKLFEEIKGLGF